MGHAAQPAVAMKVAGKTGTAAADEGPWTHAWFAGYAPAENPEIVLVVFLEKGHGGSDAAGVAREIFAAFADSQNSRVARANCGSASVRRLVAAIALLLAVWIAGDASPAATDSATTKSASPSGFPQAVRVRLWYLHPPHELASPGGCRTRQSCENVRPAKTRPSRSLVVACFRFVCPD